MELRKHFLFVITVIAGIGAFSIADANERPPSTTEVRATQYRWSGVQDTVFVAPTTSITQTITIGDRTRLIDSAGTYYRQGTTAGTWEKFNYNTISWVPFTGTVDLQGGTISPVGVFPQPNAPSPVGVFPQPN